MGLGRADVRSGVRHGAEKARGRARSGHEASVASSDDARGFRQRFKQMSAVAAASVAVAAMAICFGLWQAGASHSAVAAATDGAVDVAVATSDVKAGDVLDARAFEVRSVPAAWRSSGAVVMDSQAADLVGARALVDISAGTQLCSSFLVRGDADGRLAGIIGEGMEAVSLSVDDQTGVAGQVRAFDKVRVVSVNTVSTGEAASEVLCEAARVLSVGGDGAGEGSAYSAVTIEVDSAQADSIRVAQQAGTVSLQLLPLDALGQAGDVRG